MKHVLVSVLTQKDIEVLPSVVEFLKAQTPDAMVVVNNPSLGITSADATSKVDAEITQLERAKEDAKNREDFPAAAEYKSKIEDAKMKRMDVLRDGWKSVSPEERKKSYAKFRDQFSSLLNAEGQPTYFEAFSLQEDTTHEGLLKALIGLGTAWPQALPWGAWSFIHPQSIRPFSLLRQDARLKTYASDWSDPSKVPSELATTATRTVSPTPKIKVAPKPKKVQKSAPIDPREARKAELMRYMKMKAEAKKYGISIEGRKTVDVVQEILTREGFGVA